MPLENSLKVVIWDLDDTFWRGTLTEGDVQPIDENIRWVKELSKRGIVNCICSKNDPEMVDRVLRDLGVFDYFVFNQISFSPKGRMIEEQLRAMQLRASNALFIDDRLANLEEATFVNPGIMTITPEKIEASFCSEHAVGSPDPDMKRLRQYRELENRWCAKKSSDLTDEAFLEQSEIKVYLNRDWENNLDRVVEILKRTNQLNYTKIRSKEAELRKEFLSGYEDFGLVRVVDKYSDYGWVGFFALKYDTLIHFSFSCRIMNMGVEAWLYQHLNQPKLNIIEPVSSSIDQLRRPVPWIQWSEESDYAVDTPRSTVNAVVRGACNTDQIIPYLSGNIEFNKEFNFPAPNKNQEILRQLTCWLVLAKSSINLALRNDLENLPVFHPDVLGSSIDQKTDLVIMSPVMDFIQGYYRHKRSGSIVALGNYKADHTQQDFVEVGKEGMGHIRSPEFISWFSERFEHLGELPMEWYLSQLDNLIEHWAPRAQILFLLPNDQSFGIERYEVLAKHLSKCNQSIKEWANKHKRVRVLEFSTLVNTENLLSYDTLYLYTRKVYFEMAQAVMTEINVSGLAGSGVKLSLTKFLLSRVPYIRRDILRLHSRLTRGVLRRIELILGLSR